MRKILSVLLAVFCSISCLNLSVKAEGDPGDEPTIWVEEIETDNPFEKEWIVHYGEEEIVATQNLLTFEATIDGEEIPVYVEPIALPMTTINYSSAVAVSYKVAWKETVSLTTTIISLYIKAQYGVDVSDLATALDIYFSYQPDIYATYTQYASTESYYSVSNGVYYNKYINQNIRVCLNSSSGTSIWGPKNGTWFDPIRP